MANVCCPLLTTLERFVVAAIWWRVSDTAEPLTLPLCLSGVGTAGLAAGAAAYPPAEELPGLHGGGRPVHLLPWPQAPLQGTVVPRLRLVLPHQRPGRRAGRRAALHHRLVFFFFLISFGQSPIFSFSPSFFFCWTGSIWLSVSLSDAGGSQETLLYSESGTTCQMMVAWLLKLCRPQNVLRETFALCADVLVELDIFFTHRNLGGELN